MSPFSSHCSLTENSASSFETRGSTYGRRRACEECGIRNAKLKINEKGEKGQQRMRPHETQGQNKMGPKTHEGQKSRLKEYYEERGEDNGVVS